VSAHRPEWFCARGGCHEPRPHCKYDLAPPPIPHPPGGFTSNEIEAKWLEQTIVQRTEELLMMAGVVANIKTSGLYDLLLISLNAASTRGRKAL